MREYKLPTKHGGFGIPLPNVQVTFVAPDEIVTTPAPIPLVLTEGAEIGRVDVRVPPVIEGAEIRSVEVRVTPLSVGELPTVYGGVVPIHSVRAPGAPAPPAKAAAIMLPLKMLLVAPSNGTCAGFTFSVRLPPSGTEPPPVRLVPVLIVMEGLASMALLTPPVAMLNVPLVVIGPPVSPLRCLHWSLCLFRKILVPRRR